MREKRKLTLLHVGAKIGIKPKVIDHIEHGRKIIGREEIDAFLECYEFSFKLFEEMLELKPVTKQTTNLFFLSRKIF
jgi:hypothetical protein